jgi:hypothetical protein
MLLLVKQLPALSLDPAAGDPLVSASTKRVSDPLKSKPSSIAVDLSGRTLANSSLRTSLLGESTSIILFFCPKNSTLNGKSKSEERAVEVSLNEMQISWTRIRTTRKIELRTSKT